MGSGRAPLPPGRVRWVAAQIVASFFTPLVHRWLLRQEAFISRQGRPLTAAETNSARRIGLNDPARVRIQTVDRIPQPGGWLLKVIARFSRVALADPVALTAGHGIYLKAELENDPVVIRHELAHVGQYERLGRRAFLQQYIRDCLAAGYTASPLEVEARRLSAVDAGRHPSLDQKFDRDRLHDGQVVDLDRGGPGA